MSWRSLRERVAGARKGELGGLAGDSLYVAIWQAAISIADLVQIALITHALGLDEYGRLAVAASFVLLVTQFFDVRVGVAATTLGARELGHDDRRAAGVFQLSYLIDAATGLLGFVIVVGLGLALGPSLVGEDGALLVALYATVVLASTLEDSSMAVLRLLDRYRLVATYTVVLEAIRVGLVVLALVVWDSLVAVIVALLVQRLLVAVVQAASSGISFRRATRRPLFTSSEVGTVRDIRGSMFRTVFHTNLVSYARLTQTQLPTVLLGAISGTFQAGLYKVGMAAAAAVGRLADPAYAAFLPRISRLYAAGREHDVRQLVFRVTRISVPVMLVVVLAMAALHDPILEILGGGDAESAWPVLIMGSLAYGINGAVFWNVGVLFATGRAGVVARVAVAFVIFQVAILVPLILAWDANGAALSLLLTLGLSNALITYRAVQSLRSSPGPPRGDVAAEAGSEAFAIATEPHE